MLIEKFPKKEEMKDEKYYMITIKKGTSKTFITTCFTNDTNEQEILPIMQEKLESEIERLKFSHECSLSGRFESFKYPTNIKLEEVKRIITEAGWSDYKKVKNGFTGKFEKSKSVIKYGNGNKVENISYYFVENRKADDVS